MGRKNSSAVLFNIEGGAWFGISFLRQTWTTRSSGRDEGNNGCGCKGILCLRPSKGRICVLVSGKKMHLPICQSRRNLQASRCFAESLCSVVDSRVQGRLATWEQQSEVESRLVNERMLGSEPEKIGVQNLLVEDWVSLDRSRQKEHWKHDDPGSQCPTRYLEMQDHRIHLGLEVDHRGERRFPRSPHHHRHQWHVHHHDV
jgi:hypothetical protein